MGEQWIRSCSLDISGAGVSLSVSDLRVRFSIKQATIQSPDAAIIRVTNLSNATAQKIQKAKAGQKVTLTAGYQSGSGVVFKGDVQEVRCGRENPTDTLLTIWAAGGDAGYNYAVVNKTLAKGSTHKDHHSALMEAFGKFGVTAGYIPPGVLEKVKFPRAVPLFGMARDHMRKLAQAVGCSWSITDDKLDLVPIGQAKPGGITEINAKTGMIGMPMQTPAGVIVRCLINPSLRPKQKIKLNNASIQLSSFDQSYTGSAVNNAAPNMGALSADGTYIILAIDLEGDTRGGPWYQDLICYAEATGPTNSSSKPYTTVPSYAGG